ncbi:hypothetical protein BC940DRAFT_324833 [Gongronella butleri]|nr:hypothetical protein BC940DRAFT_324833 [Gongronella butleri]
MVLADLAELSKKRPMLAKNVEVLQGSLNLALALAEGTKSQQAGGPAVIQVNTWNSGDVVVNQSSPNERKQPDTARILIFFATWDNVSVKKGTKTFSFAPRPAPSSRISDEDRAMLAPLYTIKINDKHLAGTSPSVVDAYEANLESLASNSSLVRRPAAFDFLKRALRVPLNDLRAFLWKDCGEDTASKVVDDESKLIELVRLVLTDFSANCLKPAYPAETNERTPFVESIVPIFKYLSSVQQSISFVW